MPFIQTAKTALQCEEARESRSHGRYMAARSRPLRKIMWGTALRAGRSSAAPQVDTWNTGYALLRDRLFYDRWKRDSRRRGIRAWRERSRKSCHEEPSRERWCRPRDKHRL